MKRTETNSTFVLARWANDDLIQIPKTKAEFVSPRRIGVATCCIACVFSCNEPHDVPLSSLPRMPTKTLLRVRVTGHDFQWRIQYVGNDGQLGTQDDLTSAQHLHLPVDANVELDLRSEDYAYTLFLPHWDLMETAIPADPYPLRFETDDQGTYELLGSQMCGYTHPLLLGNVIVHTRDEFDEWLTTLE